LFPILSEIASPKRKKEKSKAGLDFVHGELIGWLWFAIAVISFE